MAEAASFRLPGGFTSFWEAGVQDEKREKFDEGGVRPRPFSYPHLRPRSSLRGRSSQAGFSLASMDRFLGLHEQQGATSLLLKTAEAMVRVFSRTSNKTERMTWGILHLVELGDPSIIHDLYQALVKAIEQEPLGKSAWYYGLAYLVSQDLKKNILSPQNLQKGLEVLLRQLKEMTLDPQEESSPHFQAMFALLDVMSKLQENRLPPDAHEFSMDRIGKEYGSSRYASGIRFQALCLRQVLERIQRGQSPLEMEARQGIKGLSDLVNGSICLGLWAPQKSPGGARSLPKLQAVFQGGGFTSNGYETLELLQSAFVQAWGDPMRCQKLFEGIQEGWASGFWKRSEVFLVYGLVQMLQELALRDPEEVTRSRAVEFFEAIFSDQDKKWSERNPFVREGALRALKAVWEQGQYPNGHQAAQILQRLERAYQDKSNRFSQTTGGAKLFNRIFPEPRNWEGASGRQRPKPLKANGADLLFLELPSDDLAIFEQPASIWSVPLDLQRYVSRQQVIQSLNGYFSQKPLNSFRVMALTGPSGLGKSMEALAYARRYRSKYEIVFWFHGKGDVEAQYQELGKQMRLEVGTLKPKQAFPIVMEKLAKRKSWLLVFDDAGPPHSLSAYFPRSLGQGVHHVLVTSRTSVWQSRVDLNVMTLDESVVFLEKITGCQDPLFVQLAQELGYHPLALKQAGYYLSAYQSSMNVDGYLNLYRAERERLSFQEGSHLEGSDANSLVVYRALRVGLEAIRQENPKALQVLKLCAYVLPEGIPQVLVERWGQKAEADWKECVGLLEVHSLMEWNRKAKTVSIYPLIQSFVRQEIVGQYEPEKEIEHTRWGSLWKTEAQVDWSQVAQREWLKECVLEVVLGSFRYSNENLEDWPLAKQLAPHVRALLAHAERLEVEDAGLLADKYHQLGFVRYTQGDIDGASEDYQKAQNVRRGH